MTIEPTIHACPLCGEIADYSDDYGWSLVCHHDPYEAIEPVEVRGRIEDGEIRFPLPDAEEWKRTTGAEIIERQEKRKRERAEWLALSCDERVAIRAKQRAASPTAFMMGEIMRAQLGSSVFSRQLYGGVEPKTRTIVCSRCKDPGCENTRTEPNPHYDPNAKPFSWSGGFTVKAEGG